MEDILEVYKRPYNAEYPVVCIDEMPVQLLMDVHPPSSPKPGQPARQDYEYERNGVENLFMVFEPLQGKRFVFVEDRRRKIEWAHVMKKVADELYPNAKKILVVLDNLNTHTPASFYEAFDPQEARRLVERFEFHYTPKHGSWLNMAEIELGVLARQCLNCRIPDKETLDSIHNNTEMFLSLSFHECSGCYCRQPTLSNLQIGKSTHGAKSLFVHVQMTAKTIRQNVPVLSTAFHKTVPSLVSNF